MYEVGRSENKMIQKGKEEITIGNRSGMKGGNRERASFESVVVMNV